MMIFVGSLPLISCAMGDIILRKWSSNGIYVSRRSGAKMGNFR